MDAQTGRREDAFRSFTAALEAEPDPGSAMTMAALMATAGYLEEALALSDRALAYLAVESRRGLGINVNEDDIREFQRVVREDMRTSGD